MRVSNKIEVSSRRKTGAPNLYCCPDCCKLCSQQKPKKICSLEKEYKQEGIQF